jgi:hypothetical protein
MKLVTFPICTYLALSAATAVGGTIEGTVANMTSGEPVPCQAEVILQLQIDGQFVPFRDTTSDMEGRFRLKGIPEGKDNLYLLGANRHGIFYPGPRIQLVDPKPNAYAELAVCDAVTKPNPLVLKKMDVTIRPKLGLLRVTESLLIDNPTHATFIGEAAGDYPPTTLVLSIPADFERTTFEKEFYGRRFAIVNNKVITGIPWTPGERELKYTYVLRNTKESTSWRRPLDLPCSDVTVRIEGRSPDEVRCELLDRVQADKGGVVFASGGHALPAGQVLRVELGRLPLPWMSYSKWAAVAILLVIVAATSWLHFVRSRDAASREAVRQTPREVRKRRAA